MSRGGGGGGAGGGQLQLGSPHTIRGISGLNIRRQRGSLIIVIAMKAATVHEP